MNRFFILIFLMSCASLATNGSPITTPKDKTSAGIGMSGAISSGGAFPLAPVISVRYGLSENADVGFSGFPLLGIFNTDVKFRNSNPKDTTFFTTSIYGFGLSYIQIDSNRIFFISPYVGSGLGNEKLYLSLRNVFPLASGNIETPFFIPQISFGLTLGESIKFNPEVGIMLPWYLKFYQEGLILYAGNIVFYFNFSVFYMPKK